MGKKIRWGAASQAICLIVFLTLCSCKKELSVSYTVTMEDPSSHQFHVELKCEGLTEDTAVLAMPAWMPGYYQIMNYADDAGNVSAYDFSQNKLNIVKKDTASWQVVTRGKSFSLKYDVRSERRFFANNFLDTTHGYIIPPATFMFIKGHLDVPVHIKMVPDPKWDGVATGLTPVPGKKNEFSAADFDMLYDCPVLLGNLEELQSFEVNGVRHRFIGYNPGEFDRQSFMAELKKAVETAVKVIGEVPYKEYTFIGIGPGYGGIEHLNNTTVSLGGSRMNDTRSMTEVMKFLTHEYFHNYNVKRIRPFELGPFDYTRENRTNLLWVSEGITVYYEYIILRRAGILSDEEFYSSLASTVSAYENDPGRKFQSLDEASYNTWSDGPFGSRDPQNDRSISCYDKGAIAGMILDFSIRYSTGNTKNLDDVMRLLYQKYYKQKGRGFTDAEFREACESVAGCSLTDEFEYVSTTKEIDYRKYLSYAGLKMDSKVDPNGHRVFTILKQENVPVSQVIEKW